MLQYRLTHPVSEKTRLVNWSFELKMLNYLKQMYLQKIIPVYIHTYSTRKPQKTTTANLFFEICFVYIVYSNKMTAVSRLYLEVSFGYYNMFKF